ncbi:MAG: hypothetical protein ABIH23_12755 [bacterium]
MTSDLVDRAIRTSFIVTIVIWPFLILYISSPWALGFVLASLWSTANLSLISIAVREYFGEQRWGRLGLFFGVKFPLLYGLGLWGLYQRAVPMASVLVGFHMIFVVLVLKVLSRQLFTGEDVSDIPVGGDVPVSGNEESV